VKKFGLFVSVLFLSLSPSFALASETQLTWERSQVQQVEIEATIAESITQLSLVGQGQLIQFKVSPQLTTNGRYLYQALIPDSFVSWNSKVRVITL
jgi:hypothetical protein